MIGSLPEEDVATAATARTDDVRGRSESVSSALSDDKKAPAAIETDSFSYHRRADQPLRQKARRNSEDPSQGRHTLRDEYGWPIHTDLLISSRVDGKEAQAAAWYRISPESLPEMGSRMKAAVRLGVPVFLRRVAWILYSSSRVVPGRYASLLDTRSAHLSQIMVDFDEHFPYLFPNNAHFQGTSSFAPVIRVAGVGSALPELPRPAIYESLRRVLWALLSFLPTLPYSQPLSLVVAFVFLVLKEEPEERIFWVVVTLLRDICPQDLFEDTVTQSFVDREAFCGVLRARMPRLHEHLNRLDVPVNIIVAPWFQQLFVDILPPQCTVRVFDSLLYEGFKVVYRIGLAVFKLNEHALMTCTAASEVTALLRHAITRSLQDPFELMGTAFERIGSLPMSLIERERREAKQRLAEMAAVRRFSLSARRMSLASRAVS